MMPISAARAEMTCERCGDEHGVVWFAPSDLWNLTMREGDRANVDRYSFCCPNCFIRLANEALGEEGIWRVSLEGDPQIEPVNRVVTLLSAHREEFIAQCRAAGDSEQEAAQILADFERDHLREAAA